MKIVALLLVVVVVFGVGIGRMLLSARAELVAQREAVAAAWEKVDVALQPRGELIANLVDTVKDFTFRERDVLTGVAQARILLIDAKGPEQRIQANSALDGAVGRLLVVVENYPELRSSAQFQRLIEELRETEAQIAVERRKYNEKVQAYNIGIEQFPKNMAAAVFGFRRNDAYFLTEPAASRETPKVRF